LGASGEKFCADFREAWKGVIVGIAKAILIIPLSTKEMTQILQNQ
jgi:hypothetical protein